MKTLILFAACVTLSVHVGAQTYDNKPSERRLKFGENARILGHEIAERGPHHRVWNKILAGTNELGQVELSTNVAFVELATGMHYWEDERWQESKEEFSVVPGWAVADKGLHKVSLAYNLNSAGPVVVRLPDGKVMRSQVLSLHYLDAASGQSVRLGEVKDCAGKVLPPNQVIWEDAFDGIRGDVRITYTRAGLEQDVIVREQIPTPESFGLNPETTRLTVLTEFINPPPAALEQLAGGAGGAIDENVNFGSMQIGRGRAFSQRTNSIEEATERAAPVIKKWMKVNGRTFLLEQVSFPDIRMELEQLPQSAAVSRAPARTLLAGLDVPEPRVSVSPERNFEIAQVRHETPGYVLDYVQLNSGLTNYTFRADTTYYVTAPVNLFGTNYVEGGTVIKYTNFIYSQWSAAAQLYFNPGSMLAFRTSAYRPAVFTAKDDNSVGEVLPDSTGNPAASTYGYGFAAIRFPYLDRPLDAHDLRISYSFYSLMVESGTVIPEVRDGQFTHNSTGLYLQWVQSACRNLLFYNSTYRAIAGFNGTVHAEHLTINVANHCFMGGSFYVTNSLFVGAGLVVATNWPTTLNGAYNTTLSSSSGIFTTVGAGSHYLATNSPYRDIGTTNVSPAMQAALARTTTYPPMVWFGTNFTSDVILGPQAERDEVLPDLGYHYEPWDYIMSCSVSNATMIITNGAVLGVCDQYYGIWLKQGSRLLSSGTPTRQNAIIYYGGIQAHASNPDPDAGDWNMIDAYHQGGARPSALLQFTKIIVPINAGGYSCVLVSYQGREMAELEVRNCEIFAPGRWVDFVDSSGSSAVTFENNLVSYCNVEFLSAGLVSIRNNLFRGNYSGDPSLSVEIYMEDQDAVAYVARDNAFDDCYAKVWGWNGNHSTNGGNNAYLNGAEAGFDYFDGDIVTNLTWVSGPLGEFYQPSDSPLSNVGSTAAHQVGLYHYTTTTNQVRETNSTVDIGYHYVALDANRNPVDSDWDGVPDYLEDANGNGVTDPGETLWNLAILAHPGDQTVHLAGNATFSVTAEGEQPLHFQWKFNGANLAGATNSFLTISAARATNSGLYSVVVTNIGGSITSSNAALAVDNTVLFTNFCDVSALKINGDARATNTADGCVLQLTRADSALGGSAFLKSTVPLGNHASFSTFFSFRLSQSGGSTDPADGHIGADGIVFVVHTSYSESVGGLGGGIGYQGIGSSIGIEFDTWCNTFDPTGDGNHVGGNYGGIMTNATPTAHVSPDFNDSNIWYAWIDYNGLATNLEVRISQTNQRPATAALTWTINLMDQLQSSNAYAGFTAATGGAFNQQDIISWEFTTDYDPIGRPSNSVPWVQMHSPTNGEVFVITPTNILLLAFATNASGPLESVQFYTGTNSLGSASMISNNLFELLWTNAPAGGFTIEAVATNIMGSVVSAVTITNNAMPVVSIIEPTNGQSFTGEVVSVTLKATASDPDDSVTNVRFYHGTNFLGIATPSGSYSNYAWNSLTSGVYTITALATDSRGAKTTSAIKVFKVNSTNIPPSVAITFPTNGAVFAADSDLTITATASDSDGSVTNVEFFVNGVLLGNDQSSPYSIEECCWKPGTYQIFAKAIDNLGASKLSETNTIVIGERALTAGDGFWDPVFGSSTFNYIGSLLHRKRHA